MKRFDRMLQRWRLSVARPYIKRGDKLLDIGCYDGQLFKHVDGLSLGIGIDPGAARTFEEGNIRVIRGLFPQDVPDVGPFDCITMLAVLEHILPKDQESLANGIFKHLKPGGFLMVTVPSTHVDYILHILKFFRIIDGMSLEQHHGFNPDESPEIFKRAGMELHARKSFQFGLNNLFVFRKP